MKPIYKRLIYWLIATFAVVVFFLFILSDRVKHEFPVGMALLGGFLSLVVSMGAVVTFLNAYPFKNQKQEGDFSIFLGLCSILSLFVVGGIIIYQGSYFEKNELGRSGVPTTGWVVGKLCGTPYYEVKNCKVTVHYVNHKDEVAEGELIVDAPLCKCLAFGDTMEIIYSPKSKSTIKFSHLDVDRERIISVCDGLEWNGDQMPFRPF